MCRRGFNRHLILWGEHLARPESADQPSSEIRTLLPINFKKLAPKC